MSVVTEKTFDSEGPNWAHDADFDDNCFHCGKKLSVPFVYWLGHDHKSLCLHPHCAAKLGGALLRDFHEMAFGKARADGWHTKLKADIEEIAV